MEFLDKILSQKTSERHPPDTQTTKYCITALRDFDPSVSIEMVMAKRWCDNRKQSSVSFEPSANSSSNKDSCTTSMIVPKKEYIYPATTPAISSSLMWEAQAEAWARSQRATKSSNSTSQKNWEEMFHKCQEQLSAKDVEVVSLQKKFSDLVQQLTTRNQQMQEMETEYRRLKSHCEVMTAQMAEMKADLQQKEAQTTLLSEEVSQYRVILQCKETEIREKDMELREKIQLIMELQAVINRLKRKSNVGLDPVGENMQQNTSIAMDLVDESVASPPESNQHDVSSSMMEMVPMSQETEAPVPPSPSMSLHHDTIRNIVNPFAGAEVSRDVFSNREQLAVGRLLRSAQRPQAIPYGSLSPSYGSQLTQTQNDLDFSRLRGGWFNSLATFDMVGSQSPVAPSPSRVVVKNYVTNNVMHQQVNIFRDERNSPLMFHSQEAGELEAPRPPLNSPSAAASKAWTVATDEMPPPPRRHLPKLKLDAEFNTLMQPEDSQGALVRDGLFKKPTFLPPRMSTSTRPSINLYPCAVSTQQAPREPDNAVDEPGGGDRYGQENVPPSRPPLHISSMDLTTCFDPKVSSTGIVSAGNFQQGLRGFMGMAVDQENAPAVREPLRKEKRKGGLAMRESSPPSKVTRELPRIVFPPVVTSANPPPPPPHAAAPMFAANDMTSMMDFSHLVASTKVVDFKGMKDAALDKENAGAATKMHHGQPRSQSVPPSSSQEVAPWGFSSQASSQRATSAVMDHGSDTHNEVLSEKTVPIINTDEYMQAAGLVDGAFTTCLDKFKGYRGVTNPWTKLQELDVWRIVTAYLREQANFVVVSSQSGPAKPNVGSRFTFNGETFLVEKKIGEGSYGCVFQLANCTTGAMSHVAFKIQTSGLALEVYYVWQIIRRLKKFLLRSSSRSVIDVTNSICTFYHVESFMDETDENRPIGHGFRATMPFVKLRLLDVFNGLLKLTDRELLAAYVAVEILHITHQLHMNAKMLHCDYKLDNFLVQKPFPILNAEDCLIRGTILPNRKTSVLLLIDFGRAVDLKLYDADAVFHVRSGVQGHTCTEMQVDKPWKFQIDLFNVASVVYSCLCRSVMSVRYSSNTSQWLPKLVPNHKRTFKAHDVWPVFFVDLLNVADCSVDNYPDLQGLAASLESVILRNVDAYNRQAKLSNEMFFS